MNLRIQLFGLVPLQQLHGCNLLGVAVWESMWNVEHMQINLWLSVTSIVRAGKRIEINLAWAVGDVQVACPQ